MMGQRQVDQAALFYEFSLERHVPGGHLLRSIDRFVDLSEVRSRLAPFYSSTGRPSIDPELLVRMLLVGYCYGIRSERRLTASAPATNRLRRKRSPCLLMLPSRSFPPLECCFGTSPIQAEKLRPDRNALGSATLATRAVASVGPTPGM